MAWGYSGSTELSPAPNLPPPIVWWSTPELMPDPWLNCHVSPSSLVNAERLCLLGKMSCDTKVRPVAGSVKRIGSLVLSPVVRKLLLNHCALAGDELSSKLARS